LLHGKKKGGGGKRRGSKGRKSGRKRWKEKKGRRISLSHQDSNRRRTAPINTRKPRIWAGKSNLRIQDEEAGHASRGLIKKKGDVPRGGAVPHVQRKAIEETVIMTERGGGKEPGYRAEGRNVL